MLVVQSNASYLNEWEAHSKVEGYFILSTTNAFPPSNGTVCNTAQVIKAVMSLAAEAEMGAVFINAKQASPMQHTLIEMGHLQPPTTIKTDNLTAFGIITNKIIPKAIKTMDMQFY